MAEVEIGHVSDFFAHPVVAGIDLTDSLKIGDRIHIQGHTTNLEMVIESIQIEHHSVPKAEAGDSVGIKVPDRVRHGDKVYRLN